MKKLHPDEDGSGSIHPDYPAVLRALDEVNRVMTSTDLALKSAENVKELADLALAAWSGSWL